VRDGQDGGGALALLVIGRLLQLLQLLGEPRQLLVVLLLLGNLAQLHQLALLHRQVVQGLPEAHLLLHHLRAGTKNHITVGMLKTGFTK